MSDKLQGHPSDYGSRTLDDETANSRELQGDEDFRETNASAPATRGTIQPGDVRAAQEIAENGESPGTGT